MPTTAEINKYRKELMKKFIEEGVESFLESDILELLLVLSIPKGDIKPLAAQLLQHYRELSNVHDAPLKELLEIPGINIRTALFIKIAKECSEYYLRQKVKKQNLRSGMDIIDYCRLKMSGMTDEHFTTFFLNTQGEVIEVIETTQRGKVDQTLIYPRTIIERALFHNAAALIFARNHPGGTIKPTHADKELTNRIVSAAETMDIEVFDHLIIGPDKHFSFRDEGLIAGRKEFSPAPRISMHNRRQQALSLNSIRVTV
jgi:DNA repair protein RadC